MFSRLAAHLSCLKDVKRRGKGKEEQEGKKNGNEFKVRGRFGPEYLIKFLARRR